MPLLLSVTDAACAHNLPQGETTYRHRLQPGLPRQPWWAPPLHLPLASPLFLPLSSSPGVQQQGYTWPPPRAPCLSWRWSGRTLGLLCSASPGWPRLAPRTRSTKQSRPAAAACGCAKLPRWPTVLVPWTLNLPLRAVFRGSASLHKRSEFPQAALGTVIHGLWCVPLHI